MARESADRKLLTDRLIARLPPASVGKRSQIHDTKVDRLAIRVTDRGEKSFVLYARYPRAPSSPARRRLGRYPELSLDGARRKARAWLDLIEQGIDPADEDERKQRESAAHRSNTFASVAQEFIRQRVIGVRHYDQLSARAAAYLKAHPNKNLSHLAALARVVRSSSARINMRKAPAVILDIDREFVNRWGNRPISSITPREVRQILAAAVRRGAPYRAFNLLTHAKMLFSWVVSRDDEYGVTRSPCERMRPQIEIGEKLARERVLTDTELRAFWLSSAALGYPYGPLFQLLALTGQRKSDVADARWREFDLENNLWVIPAERMKMATAHVVPLTADMVALLEKLPRFDKGDHIFSFNFGAAPVGGFSKAKLQLDEKMRIGSLDSFVIHDVRRTVRTRLVGLEIAPGLKVPPHVAELVIAHAKPGLHKVYDLHTYNDEKRRALDLWSAELRRIVNEPGPDGDVILFPAAAVAV